MSKIASKTIAIVVTLLLAISFVVTGSFMQTVSKLSAATPDKTIETGVTNRVKYGQTFTVAKANGVTVKTPGGTYAKTTGDSPVELNNANLTSDATVTASQVGIYEITYSASDDKGKYASYTYNVESYMDYEYLFVVDGYGAAIPTYWGESDTAIALPSATLYYYDEVTEKYLPDTATSEIFCRVTKPGAADVTHGKAALDAGTATVTPDVVGTYFVTYYAEVANGDNLFSEEYTMQVQTRFSDTKAPTLTISDVASTSSSNTQIKLPVATVSDDYDTRVNTSIRVQHDFGDGLVDVPDVVVDKKTGYASFDGEGRALYYKAGANGARYAYNADGTVATTTVVAEAAKAIFDNNNFMTFYPTDDGEYKISYNAMDSTGKYEDTTANKTVEYAYPVRVSDTTAPVFNKMDESLIPSTWGKTVYKYSEEKDNSNEDDITEKVENTNIRFPIPELYDNKDKESDLRVSFTLADKNSKTVMSFDNIYSDNAADARYAATGDFGSSGATYYFFRYWNSQDYKDKKFSVSSTDGKITDNGSSFNFGENAYMLIYYNDNASAVTAGFFNFSLWKATDSLGQYTVTYRARDDQGNSATKTYNINLQNRFEDTTLPSVTFNEPDYFVFRNYETEQSITDVSATDSNDSRLDVEYYLAFNLSFTAESDGTFDFDKNIPAAEKEAWLNKANPNLVELDPTLGTNKLTLEKIGTDFVFTLDNKEGDEKTVKLGANDKKEVYVAMKATDAAGNTTSYIKSVKIVDGTTAPAVANYNPQFGNVNEAVGKVGEEYNFGSFYIQYANDEDRNYTGFEVYVQRVQDSAATPNAVKSAPLNNVSFETYSDNGNGNTRKLHVDNIRFTPSKSGTYMIVVRGFHVSGASNVAMFFRNVEGTDSDIKDGSAVLGDKLNYNTTYSLPNDYTGPASWVGTKVGVLRSITGGRFTLMGSEFTAKATTTYSFSDYTFEYNHNAQGTIEEFNNNNITNGVSIGSLVKYNYEGNIVGVAYGKKLAKDLTNKADVKPLIADNYESKANYTSTFTDTQTATFRLLGVMPTYSEITKTEKVNDADVTTYGFVRLPNISASSVNGNATSITCEVTDPDGVAVEVYDKEDAKPVNYDGAALVGNEFLFEATTDGTYTVTYTATLNNQTATASYTIKAGDVIAPEFTVGIGYVNNTYYASNNTASASINDVFDFASISVSSNETSTTDFKYSKKIITPDGETLAEVTSATKKNNGTSYTFTLNGTYQVVYSVTDAAGNVTTQNYYITVTSSSSNVSTEAITTLSVVLIVVGVILIAGIIIYLIRFRKRKSVKAV